MNKHKYAICSDLDGCLDPMIIGICYEVLKVGDILSYYDASANLYNTGQTIIDIHQANNQAYDYIMTTEGNDTEYRYSIMVLNEDSDSSPKTAK